MALVSVDTSKVLEPFVNTVLAPVMARLPFMGRATSYFVAAERTGKAINEFKRCNCSLRNPIFWVQSASALSTTTGAVLSSVHGAARLTGNQMEWMIILSGTLQTFGDRLNGTASWQSTIF